MIETDKVLSKLASIFTALLIASFQVTKVTPGSRYIILGLAIAVLLCKTKGILDLTFSHYYFFFAISILYAYTSSLWAFLPSRSLTMAKRMLDSFVCLAMIYLAYEKDDSSEQFMHSVKWGGYLIALFLIILYRPSGLYNMMISAANRMTESYGNVNGHAMAMAYCCVIEFIEIAQRKRIRFFSFLFFILSLFPILATQSRKAFLIIILGFLFTTVFYSFEAKNLLKTVGILILMFFSLFVFLRLFSSLPVFSGIYTRMTLLTNFVKGKGYAGESMVERDQLIRIGWEQFLRTPTLGIGIDNAIEITMIYNDIPYDYLHNNYIELLCCGGIVGFTIYYSRYIYLVFILGKNILHRTSDYYPCLIMMMILLLMDYGCVTYFERLDQTFVLLLFLQAKFINRKDLSFDIQTSHVRCAYIN